MRKARFEKVNFRDKKVFSSYSDEDFPNETYSVQDALDTADLVELVVNGLEKKGASVKVFPYLGLRLKTPGGLSEEIRSSFNVKFNDFSLDCNIVCVGGDIYLNIDTKTTKNKDNFTGKKANEILCIPYESIEPGDEDLIVDYIFSYLEEQAELDTHPNMTKSPDDKEKDFSRMSRCVEEKIASYAEKKGKESLYRGFDVDVSRWSLYGGEVKVALREHKKYQDITKFSFVVSYAGEGFWEVSVPELADGIIVQVTSDFEIPRKDTIELGKFVSSSIDEMFRDFLPVK